MDISEFLTARLDEDEAIARHAIFLRENRGQWQVGSVTYRQDYAFVSILTDGGVEIAGSGFDGTGGVHGEVFATHIARHDPARVLRAVDAHRRIVARYAYRRSMQSEDTDGPATWDDLTLHYYEVCCDLAATYADHPDYDARWQRF